MSDNNTVGGVNPSYDVCKEVSLFCPVEATTLGYYPNLGINIFFSAGFAAAGAATLVLGIWKRTWGFSLFITAGIALELAGYASRIPLHYNPWNSQAFQAQICAIILGPTLICIGIYLTLQHVCQALCPQLSRIRPRLYPWIFVPADVSCLIIQAMGGGLAASATTDMANINESMLNAGNRAIIAGIALQVVVLGAFGLAAVDYYVRVRKWIRGSESRRVGAAPSAAAISLWSDKRFQWFVRAVTAAYACVLIRCIYRIAEMAGGWGNEIMQDEPSFIVLEGFMILIAVVLLASFPPGILFPFMALSRKQKAANAAHAAEAQEVAAADDTEKTERTEKSTGTAAGQVVGDGGETGDNQATSSLESKK